MGRAFLYSATVLSLFAMLSLAGEAGAQGCAMCKTTVGGPGDPLASGINTSIMFMMTMPFILFAVVGGWLTYMFWRSGPNTVGETGSKPELKVLTTEREGAR